jgi:hypothetical protein
MINDSTTTNELLRNFSTKEIIEYEPRHVVCIFLVFFLETFAKRSSVKTKKQNLKTLNLQGLTSISSC